MALFNERLPEILDAKLVIACHDELVLECPKEQAKEVARFLEEAMVDGMDEVINPGPEADHPDRVPVEVDVVIVESWGRGS
jgi:DNA polymerase I-like protein with 3'-5' exonuclease and polymerase domains